MSRLMKRSNRSKTKNLLFSFNNTILVCRAFQIHRVYLKSQYKSNKNDSSSKMWNNNVLTQDFEFSRKLIFVQQRATFSKYNGNSTTRASIVLIRFYLRNTNYYMAIVLNDTAYSPLNTKVSSKFDYIVEDYNARMKMRLGFINSSR